MKRSNLSIFDLDHTLLSVNGSFHFAQFLYKKELLTLPELSYLALYYFRHKVLGMPMRKLYSKIFHRLFIGRSLQQMRDVADEFVQQLPDKIFNSEVIKRLSDAREKGDQLLILSSSPQFLVEAFALRLGVERGEGTKLQIGPSGELVDIAEVMEGSEKAYLVQNWSQEHGIPLLNMTAYTDSSLDLPLLDRAGLRRNSYQRGVRCINESVRLKFLMNGLRSHLRERESNPLILLGPLFLLAM